MKRYRPFVKLHLPQDEGMYHHKEGNYLAYNDPCRDSTVEKVVEAYERGELMRKDNDRPIIVCLCGSTRFKDAFVDAALRETLAGNIVLTIGCDMRTDAEIFGMTSPNQEDWTEKQQSIKKKLDALHLKKVEMADEILILNVGGYIGWSTRNELNHAIEFGKIVRYRTLALKDGQIEVK